VAKKPVIKCRHCGGRGEIALTGVYAETLQLVKKNPRLNGAQLAAIAGCKPTAMNNRLARLQLYGMLDSQLYGRSILWTAVPGGAR
jgi:hypothetical protein